MQALLINDGMTNGIACTSSSECSGHGIPNHFSDAARDPLSSNGDMRRRGTWDKRDGRNQHEHSWSVQHFKDSGVFAVEHVQLLQRSPCQCRSLHNADECLGVEAGLYECDDSASQGAQFFHCCWGIVTYERVANTRQSVSK